MKSPLASLERLREHSRKLAIWARAEIIDEALKLFGGHSLIRCRVFGPLFWRGGAVRPPMMIFSEASSLGIFGQELDKRKVSFSLDAKPLCSDHWFYTQSLVASVALYGGDDQYTFHPPYVPEWNEFFARRMHFHYAKLRVEPERIGIIINGVDHDSFLYGLPVSSLVPSGRGGEVLADRLTKLLLAHPEPRLAKPFDRYGRSDRGSRSVRDGALLGLALV